MAPTPTATGIVSPLVPAPTPVLSNMPISVPSNSLTQPAATITPYPIPHPVPVPIVHPSPVDTTIPNLSNNFPASYLHNASIDTEPSDDYDSTGFKIAFSSTPKIIAISSVTSLLAQEPIMPQPKNEPSSSTPILSPSQASPPFPLDIPLPLITPLKGEDSHPLANTPPLYIP